MSFQVLRDLEKPRFFILLEGNDGYHLGRLLLWIKDIANQLENLRHFKAKDSIFSSNGNLRFIEVVKSNHVFGRDDHTRGLKLRSRK